MTTRSAEVLAPSGAVGDTATSGLASNVFAALNDGFVQAIEQLAAALSDIQPGTSELLYAYAARETDLAGDLLSRWP